MAARKKFVQDYAQETRHGKTAPMSDPMNAFVEVILLAYGFKGRIAETIENLQARFVDWNELRVATLKEVRDAGAIHREDDWEVVLTLQNILMALFEQHNKVSLDHLMEETPASAKRILGRLRGLNTAMAACILELAFGIPLRARKAKIRNSMRKKRIVNQSTKKAVKTATLVIEESVPEAAAKTTKTRQASSKTTKKRSPSNAGKKKTVRKKQSSRGKK